MPALVTIVELGSFLRDAESALSDDEREELKTFLAENPDAGDVIPSTGGVRKLRWRVQSKGKRGGGRTIYYYRNQEMPLFLIGFFTKGVKSDLSEAEKRAAKRLVAQLVKEFRPAR